MKYKNYIKAIVWIAANEVGPVTPGARLIAHMADVLPEKVAEDVKNIRLGKAPRAVQDDCLSYPHNFRQMMDRTQGRRK